MKIIATGQKRCFDQEGKTVVCDGTGQDGQFQKGIDPPGPRFKIEDESVFDLLTGLIWPGNAELAEFPLSWQEALDFVNDMNTSGFSGFSDWRLPNRRELFSLIDHVHINPALDKKPFFNVFSGYYWTSTTCSRLPGQAWYIHLGGARVFKGMKHGSYMVWPVRSGRTKLRGVFQTGQKRCYDSSGEIAECEGAKITGQDGDVLAGISWPEPRFEISGSAVFDRLTNLSWLRNAGITGKPTTWKQALETVKRLNSTAFRGFNDWRLPNIRELESLTDMGNHSPALPEDHPFENVEQFYWSSTTSQYETTYAWVLYLQDGNLGVGFKQKAEFFVWPVRDGI